MAEQDRPAQDREDGHAPRAVHSADERHGGVEERERPADESVPSYAHDRPERERDTGHGGPESGERHRPRAGGDAPGRDEERAQRRERQANEAHEVGDAETAAEDVDAAPQRLAW